jgi:hypothetical protein
LNCSALDDYFMGDENGRSPWVKDVLPRGVKNIPAKIICGRRIPC